MTDTAPKPYVFVLMPFSDDFDDAYKLGIKPACEHAGAYAERVDEQIFEESILQRIYNQIAKADIVVADMTGRNPNVFYETGYAHALGKHVVLLTQRADDIPFDLQHYPHIVYGGRISDLIPELEKRIRWAIQHPQDAASTAHQLVLYFNGVSLTKKPVIAYPVQNKLQGFDLYIDAHNPIDRFIGTINFQIGFVTEQRFPFCDTGNTDNSSFDTPEGQKIHLLQKAFTLLPGAWDSFYGHISGRNEWFSIGQEVQFSVRVFSEREPVDYPFVVRLVPEQRGASQK